jgi:hypothetical protein
MGARHVITSNFLSLDDDPATQIFTDFDLVAEAIKKAGSKVIEPDFEFANIFPGEHYRILGGLLDVFKPLNLIDIGTYRGCSARVMLDYTPTEASVITYDLIDYKGFDWTVLTEEDFSLGRLKQYLVDLKDTEIFEQHRGYLQNADFIMLDGPKDGHFEERFLSLLGNINFDEKPRWLFIDDIRFDNMQNLWRSISSPKLDLSSFGHFSGTGLVNIQKGLTF